MRRWITVDSSAAKKFAKLAEKARKESDVEEKNSHQEKTSHQENNTAATTIEQELDCVAKTLSDSQAYVGCIVFNVKDRFQEMKDTKGEDYAMNYMKTHWGNIDLAKVLN